MKSILSLFEGKIGRVVLSEGGLVRLMFFKDKDGKIKEKFLVYIPDKEYLIRRKAKMGLNTVWKMQEG